MAYLTPPPTAKSKSKKYGLFQNLEKRDYYEDVWGSPDPGEGAEGTADKCESESDSENEKSFSKSPEGQRLFGSSKKQTRGGSVSGGSSDVAGGSDNVVDLTEDREAGAGPQFKIVPCIDRRRSVPMQKLLQTKKYGLFAPAQSLNNGMESEDSSEDDAEQEEEEQQNNTSKDVDDDDVVLVKAVTTKPARSKTVRGMPRPASRKLVRQQLQERDKAKKADERGARGVERVAKATKVSARAMAKAQKAAKATLKKKADRRTGFVWVDRVDSEGYRRYD